MLRKTLSFLLKRTEKLVLATAFLMAGAASAWGLYQDDEPAALSKAWKARK
jgi:cyclic lactone autoinducer peptide